MSRQPIIAANWKMHKTVSESRQFVDEFRRVVAAGARAEVVICPPFTALQAVGEALAGTGIALGAQNMYHEAKGAFTGEVAAPMLQELGVRYVILGHSERRHLFGETDALVREKVQAAVAAGLTPILCVGETLAERDGGATEQVVDRQVQEALAGRTGRAASQMVVAYEPVWAIGSGRPCDPGEANRVAGLIRSVVERLFDSAVAAAVRIQYGGSVKPENAGAYLAESDFDGALVGGASLDPLSFARMVH